MKPAPDVAARQSLRPCWQQLSIRWWKCVSALQTRFIQMRLQGVPFDTSCFLTPFTWCT